MFLSLRKNGEEQQWIENEILWNNTETNTQPTAFCTINPHEVVRRILKIWHLAKNKDPDLDIEMGDDAGIQFDLVIIDEIGEEDLAIGDDAGILQRKMRELEKEISGSTTSSSSSSSIGDVRALQNVEKHYRFQKKYSVIKIAKAVCLK